MGIILNKFEKKILNYLVDKYESSVSFIGANKTNQSFSVKPERIFLSYTDDSDFDTFKSVNNAVEELECLNFVSVKKERNAVVKNIILNLEELITIYILLEREEKKARNNALLGIFELYRKKDSVILSEFCTMQIKNIAENKNIEFFDGSQADFVAILDAVLFSEQQLNKKEQSEMYIRDASIRLFNDSKKLEILLQKIQNLMFKYGDFENKEHVLEECGIVPTPTSVTIKGAVILEFENQIIDLCLLGNDISLSTKTLQSLKNVHITGTKLVTIENLTSFYDFDASNACILYLGGFHNKTKRTFLKNVFNQNSNIEYFHFGDIDAGGFYIFEHLKRKTKIPFKMLSMDIATLEKYKTNWISLTDNDKKRLLKLSTDNCDYSKLIDFMLANNCKLEQETVSFIPLQGMQ